MTGQTVDLAVDGFQFYGQLEVNFYSDGNRNGQKDNG